MGAAVWSPSEGIRGGWKGPSRSFTRGENHHSLPPCAGFSVNPDCNCDPVKGAVPAGVLPVHAEPAQPWAGEHLSIPCRLCCRDNLQAVGSPCFGVQGMACLRVPCRCLSGNGNRHKFPSCNGEGCDLRFYGGAVQVLRARGEVQGVVWSPSASVAGEDSPAFAVPINLQIRPLYAKRLPEGKDLQRVNVPVHIKADVRPFCEGEESLGNQSFPFLRSEKDQVLKLAKEGGWVAPCLQAVAPIFARALPRAAYEGENRERAEGELSIPLREDCEAGSPVFKEGEEILGEISPRSLPLLHCGEELCEAGLETREVSDAGEGGEFETGGFVHGGGGGGGGTGT